MSSSAAAKPLSRGRDSLESDLVDNAEAHQRGQGKCDADGEEVDVQGKLVRGAGWVRGCHETPLFLMGGLNVCGRAQRESPRIALGAEYVGSGGSKA